MKNDKILDSLNGPRVSINPNVTTTYTVYAFPFQGFYENYPCAQVPEFDSLGQTTNRKVIKFTVNPSPEILDVETAIGGNNSTIDVTITPTVPPYIYETLPPSPTITLNTNINSTYIIDGLQAGGPYFIRVTDNNGCFVDTTVMISRIENPVHETYHLSIYPNPVNENFSISYINSESTPIQVIIYNAIGQKINSYELLNTQKEMEVSTKTWSNGVYFCKFMLENKLLGFQKIMVIK